MPNKLPQTPFSTDKRDPYWQTRLGTQEAGALALEKISHIDDVLTQEYFQHYHLDTMTAAAGHEFNLPPEGWWKFVGYHAEIDNGGGATTAYPYLIFIDPTDPIYLDAGPVFVGYGVAATYFSRQCWSPGAVNNSLLIFPGPNTYFQQAEIAQIICGPGWRVQCGLVADAGIPLANQRYLFKRVG